MSLEHKNVVRNNDEYFCTACGKSWDAADRDPPACDVATAEMTAVLGIEIPPGAEHSALAQVMKKQAWPPLKPDVYRDLERQLVEQSNTGPLTRADFGTVTAWLVDEIGDESRALLVYAPDRHSAQRYAVAVSGRTATMEVRRLAGMDKHGYGRSAYCELNPTLLKVASKMARREVVPLFTWRRLS